MTKGNYTAKIIEESSGSFYVVLTYDCKGVPGIGGRYYATRAAADRGAKAMLAKV